MGRRHGAEEAIFAAFQLAQASRRTKSGLAGQFIFYVRLERLRMGLSFCGLDSCSMNDSER
jgi:hypothetical protein